MNFPRTRATVAQVPRPIEHDRVPRVRIVTPGRSSDQTLDGSRSIANPLRLRLRLPAMTTPAQRLQVLNRELKLRPCRRGQFRGLPRTRRAVSWSFQVRCCSLRSFSSRFPALPLHSLYASMTLHSVDSIHGGQVGSFARRARKVRLSWCSMKYQTPAATDFSKCRVASFFLPRDSSWTPT